MYFLANFRHTSLPAGLLPPSWEPETPLITKKERKWIRMKWGIAECILLIHLRWGERAEHVPGVGWEEGNLCPALLPPKGVAFSGLKYIKVGWGRVGWGGGGGGGVLAMRGMWKGSRESYTYLDFEPTEMCALWPFNQNKHFLMFSLITVHAGAPVFTAFPVWSLLLSHSFKI